MGDREGSKVDRLIDYFLERLSKAADGDDWDEADGWIGKLTITGKNPRIFIVKKGRVLPGTEQDSYTGEVEMSEDTFLDLLAAAMDGKAERVFAEKYGRNHIRYKGEQWIVDSERFRKILRRVRA